MASSQNPSREQEPRGADKSVPISAAPEVERVESAQDSDPLSATAEGVVPFKDLSYVLPNITIDSFAPLRSNYGLIFGAESDAIKPFGSTSAPLSPLASSTHARPNSDIGLKKPAAVLSSNVFSEKSAADTSSNVASKKPAANPSGNVGAPKPAATLLACPGPKPVLRRRPTLLPGFQPTLKSSAAPPALSPSSAAEAPQIKPAESSDLTGNKRRVRFASVTAPAKAAATSNPSGIPQGPSFLDRVRSHSQLADVQKSLFSESTSAILKYQRDTRYKPVDPQRLAPEKPKKIPDEVLGKRTTYNKCNECEVANGAYTECEHIDDGPYDFTINEARIGQRVKPRLIEIYGVNYKRLDTLAVDRMLSARNISALLTENVDKNASKYLMHTLHGTLLGYSDSLSIMQARKIAALTGLTWRLKNNTLVSQGLKTDVTGGGVMVLKTLQVTTNNHDGSLRQMVVEVDGLWVAACWVKQEVLVSAMIEKDPDPKEKKEEATAAENVKNEPKEKATTDEKPKESNYTNGGPSNDPKQASPQSDDSYIDDPRAKPHKSRKPRATSVHSWKSASTQEFTTSERDEFEGKNDPPVKMIPHDQEPSKMQILKWKAEGMAIVLKKDLKEFKMPTGGF